MLYPLSYEGVTRALAHGRPARGCGRPLRTTRGVSLEVGLKGPQRAVSARVSRRAVPDAAQDPDSRDGRVA